MNAPPIDPRIEMMRQQFMAAMSRRNPNALPPQDVPQPMDPRLSVRPTGPILSPDGVNATLKFLF